MNWPPPAPAQSFFSKVVDDINRFVLGGLGLLVACQSLTSAPTLVVGEMIGISGYPAAAGDRNVRVQKMQCENVQQVVLTIYRVESGVADTVSERQLSRANDNMTEQCLLSIYYAEDSSSGPQVLFEYSGDLRAENGDSITFANTDSRPGFLSHPGMVTNGGLVEDSVINASKPSLFYWSLESESPSLFSRTVSFSSLEQVKQFSRENDEAFLWAVTIQPLAAP